MTFSFCIADKLLNLKIHFFLTTIKSNNINNAPHPPLHPPISKQKEMRLQKVALELELEGLEENRIKGENV